MIQLPENEKLSQINEPNAAYGRRIYFTSSIQDANESDALFRSNRSPFENLKIAIALIKTLYAEELSKPINKTLKLNKEC